MVRIKGRLRYTLCATLALLGSRPPSYFRTGPRPFILPQFLSLLLGAEMQSPILGGHCRCCTPHGRSLSLILCWASGGPGGTAEPAAAWVEPGEGPDCSASPCSIWLVPAKLRLMHRGIWISFITDEGSHVASSDQSSLTGDLFLVENNTRGE